MLAPKPRCNHTCLRQTIGAPVEKNFTTLRPHVEKNYYSQTSRALALALFLFSL